MGEPERLQGKRKFVSMYMSSLYTHTHTHRYENRERYNLHPPNIYGHPGCQDVAATAIDFMHRLGYYNHTHAG